MLIRAGRPDDAAGVAAVQIASWRAAYAHLFSPEQLAAISLAERTEFWRRFPPIVAEVEGDVVGFVAVGNGELYAIYVHPNHWGSGIGRFYDAAGWSTNGETKDAELFGMAGPVVCYAKQL